jgi:hypothetical protein
VRTPSRSVALKHDSLVQQVFGSSEWSVQAADSEKAIDVALDVDDTLFIPMGSAARSSARSSIHVTYSWRPLLLRDVLAEIASNSTCSALDQRLLGTRKVDAQKLVATVVSSVTEDVLQTAAREIIRGRFWNRRGVALRMSAPCQDNAGTEVRASLEARIAFGAEAGRSVVRVGGSALEVSEATVASLRRQRFLHWRSLAEFEDAVATDIPLLIAAGVLEERISS